jgi:prevent-host-death family protein
MHPGKTAMPAATVNIHEGKTHLSGLVEQAARGQGFVIAKAGRPLVRVVPAEPPSKERALGFLAGRGVVRADLKADFAADIETLFGTAR